MNTKNLMNKSNKYNFYKRNGKKEGTVQKIEKKEENPRLEVTEEVFNIKVKDMDEILESSTLDHKELTNSEMDYYKGLVEAILFLANEPLSVSLIARQINLDKTNTRIILDSLVDEYLEKNSGIVLKEIAAGYRFVTSEKYSEELKKIFKPKSSEKLSRSLLETLAIICYKQPITLPEIEEIRGVNSRSMVTALIQKNLIKPQGYKPIPGRPTYYVTTKEFLMKFNLGSLSDLPPLKEIKELPTDNVDDIEFEEI